MLESKIFKSTPSKSKCKLPTNICKIFFDSQGVQFINTPRILHGRSVLSTLPSNIKKNFDIPTAVYNLEPPVHSKIFSFNKFASNIDIPAFLRDNANLSCNCERPQFVNNDYKRTLIGKLNVVKNNRLRKLFTKGSVYRQSKTMCCYVLEKSQSQYNYEFRRLH